MVTFDNNHKVESNCMEAPPMCVQCVEQLFVPLDSTHTCYGSPSQITYWINCSQNILHPYFQPI
jgi:hypothetical protein